MPRRSARLCVLLAGQQPHDVPVARENTELHQIPEHTQNLQQELLKSEEADEEKQGRFQFYLFSSQVMHSWLDWSLYF